jgi:predicted nucleotidyltransferase
MNAHAIRLKEYFDSRSDVSFALLFGSQAEGRAIKESDSDIAIYFVDDPHHNRQGSPNDGSKTW